MAADNPVVRTRVRHLVARGPRLVLREAIDAVPAPWRAAELATAAEQAGAPARVALAWRAVEAPAEVDTRPESLRWMAAADETRSYLCPPLPLRARDVEKGITAAASRAEVCGECGNVFREHGADQLHLFPALCNARVCLPCMRKALFRRLDRWMPIFATRLRRAYSRWFVTIGSVRAVETRADVGRYTRALGTLVKMMRRGVPSYGILPRSWVAGVRALEIVPRTEGGFAHAHLTVIRTSFIPYGLSQGKLPDGARGEQLGMRQLLRRLGLGEVFQEERVKDNEEDAVKDYMGKVSAYMAKVEGDAGKGSDRWRTWDGRRDLQRAMRGVRLIEPFGDARGLLAGPDRSTRYREGVKLGALERVGGYNPRDPDSWRWVPAEQRGLLFGELDVQRGAADRVDRATGYREDTLATWRRWADVDELKTRLALVPLAG